MGQLGSVLISNQKYESAATEEEKSEEAAPRRRKEVRRGVFGTLSKSGCVWSILIWIPALCISIAFGTPSVYANKVETPTYRVSQVCYFVPPENISIFDNDRDVDAIFMVFHPSIALQRQGLAVRSARTDYIHRPSVAFDLHKWRVFQFNNGHDSCFGGYVFYPCRTLPFIFVDQINHHLSRAVGLRYVRSLPFMPKNLSEYPSSFDISAGFDLPYDSGKQKNREGCDYRGRKRIQLINPIVRWIGGIVFLCLAFLFGYYGVECSLTHDGWRGIFGFVACAGFIGACIIGLFVFVSGWWCLVCTQRNGQEQQECNQSRHANTVPQKYPLTTTNYWGTVIGIGRTQMANVLPRAKQVAVISALAEGSGIRQIERMTGINRNTIMNLGVRVGKGCASLLDAKMRDLPCQRLQFDELWGFIGKKERHVRPDDNPQMGDVWTFCALDPDTKLVPAFKVGKRTVETTNAFVSDVASRLANRVQLSTDAMISYVNAVEQAFGAGVDYAQIVKVFESEAMDAEVIRVDKTAYAGRPDMSLATTSHVERLNGTTRLHMRRLTRLTYAFSKKFENFEAAVALHFAYYNFVKRHNALRMTPAMAAGIERDFWTVSDLVEAVA